MLQRENVNDFFDDQNCNIFLKELKYLKDHLEKVGEWPIKTIGHLFLKKDEL